MERPSPLDGVDETAAHRQGHGQFELGGSCRCSFSVPLLVVRADPDEREALLSIGRPYFVPRRARRDRIGVWLTDDTDWDEIRELVSESYRVLTPKKLTALLDSQAAISFLGGVSARATSESRSRQTQQASLHG
jgi:hypothetical protein